jgi:hypothetical protein
MITFTSEEKDIINKFENEPVTFQVTSVQDLTFSVFTLKGEIDRVQSDIDLAKQRIIDLTARKAQLKIKLEDVKAQTLTIAQAKIAQDLIDNPPVEAVPGEVIA